MRRREHNFCIFAKNAIPFLFRFVKKILDFGFQFHFGIAVIAKFQMAFFILPALHFIIQLGKYEFEKFLKNINACIRQNFVFHFQNQVFQRFALIYQFIFLDKFLDCPAFRENIGKFFARFWNNGKVFKIIRVFAVVKRN
ncbi:hypothetical protein R83H12_02601 [Fibrobacteria bacterium R8-3-H12]